MSHLTLLLLLLVTITFPSENVINKQIMTAPKATRIDLPNETKIAASIKCREKSPSIKIIRRGIIKKIELKQIIVQSIRLLLLLVHLTITRSKLT